MCKVIIGIVAKHEKSERIRTDSLIRDEVKQAIYDNGGIAIGILSPNNEILYADDNWIISDNLSIGACIENMILRATKLGLGTLWIRDIIHIEDKLTELIELDNFELNSALAIGYSNDNTKKKVKKDLNSIVKWFK